MCHPLWTAALCAHQPAAACRARGRSEAPPSSRSSNEVRRCVGVGAVGVRTHGRGTEARGPRSEAQLAFVVRRLRASGRCSLSHVVGCAQGSTTCATREGAVFWNPCLASAERQNVNRTAVEQVRGLWESVLAPLGRTAAHARVRADASSARLASPLLARLAPSHAGTMLAQRILWSSLAPHPHPPARPAQAHAHAARKFAPRAASASRARVAFHDMTNVSERHRARGVLRRRRAPR